MLQLRMLATGEIISEADYRNLHPQCMFAHELQPLDDAALLPPVEVPPTVAQYTAAIQSMLDAKAQERHYDSILSACTYVTSTNATFHAEGQACVQWRDAVWAKSYDLMKQVEAGTLAQPTIPALLAMLPAMAWPA